ncbi:hypothetical protein V5799_031560 [Amblyomma americanum]|uniref:Uncharacterized protein n=1 Tax=Amblyomma americanum TaxID=6943 RepID=A0AAQ4DTN9_AMBAM
MQDSSPRNRTAAAAWTAPSFLFTKNPGHRLSFICVLSGVLVGAAAAISTGIYVWSPQEGEVDVSPFCCPDLARELAWYLNQSIDPCKDFFSYVCSNVIGDKKRREDDLQKQLEQSLLTGATSEAKPRGVAGRFLTSFYRSCVTTLPYPQSFFRSLASALVRDSWERQELVDTRSAILYIFRASVKYQLPSAVDVSFSRMKSTVLLKSREICTHSSHYYDAMTAVVDAMNERPNAVTLSSESAFRFRGQLCDALSSSLRMKRRYSTHNDSHQIQAELWSKEDLDAGFSVYGSSVRSVRFVTAVGFRQIRLIYDQFASENTNSTAAAKRVAFLVWHSVVHGAEHFYATLNDSHRFLFTVCRTRIYIMRAFWEAFAAEMLTSPDKDAVAHALFTSVKRSVYADIRESLIFDADDVERLHSFFENLVLVTPTEASRISIAVPNASDSLGENILRGNSYLFLVQKEREENLTDVRRVVYEEVTFLGERQLLLSSTIYGYIRAGSSDYELPNNARVGRLLAEAIWHMALVKMNWSSKSRDNINRFKKCFPENKLGDIKTDLTNNLVVIVLGLSSVVKTLNRSDWEMLKHAWSLWRISNAQFFFMLSTYYRCPWFWWSHYGRMTNVSLLYNEDFATAFQCHYSAPMARTRQCFLKGSRALKQ